MDMNAIKGTQSIAFSESPYLVSAGSVAGKKEGEGPLGKYFDIASEDDLFGEKTWELAEGTMQKLACMLALKNAGVQPEEVRYLFGGDLLRQGIATSMGAEELQIPVFGLFGACSTSGEALALAAMTVAAGYGDLVLAATSSHFGSAEKEFRFPLGYANQRPLSSTWTVTGSGAFLVGKKKSRVRISGVTRASEELKKRIVRQAAKMLKCEVDEVDFDGHIARSDKTGEEVTLAAIGAGAMCGSDIALQVTESHSSPVSPPPYMAGAVEIELDPETGHVEILDYYAVVDCGTVINPNLARVQAEGGIVQGIGMTLY